MNCYTSFRRTRALLAMVLVLFPNHIHGQFFPTNAPTRFADSELGDTLTTTEQTPVGSGAFIPLVPINLDPTPVAAPTFLTTEPTRFVPQITVAPGSQSSVTSPPVIFSTLPPLTEAPVALGNPPLLFPPVSSAPSTLPPSSQAPVSFAPTSDFPVAIPTSLAPVSTAPTDSLIGGEFTTTSPTANGGVVPPLTSQPASASLGVTNVPTEAPAKGVLIKNPSRSPTVAVFIPPTGPKVINESIQGVTINLLGVGSLSPGDQELFGEEVSYWFNSYFNDVRRRHLQEQYGITGMETAIDVTAEDPSATGNTVTYTQSLDYTASSSSSPPPEEVVALPFQIPERRTDLVNRLQRSAPVFRTLQEPLMAPIVVQDAVPEPVKGKTWATPPVIAGIAGGAALIIGAIVFVIFFCCYGIDEKGRGNDEASESPLNHFQFTNNGSEDNVSAFDDPAETNKTGTSTDALSVGNYGDQSVATVDYDYSKAYGGSGPASVVSSVGGTLGDTTRQTAENVNAGRAALGASYESMRGVQEEVIVIEAPSGKLGVVIDTPDDGAPLVHAVKDSSVIADLIQVGDKLIAVDDDDVQAMTAIKVSKLISKRSNNPVRRLTVVRTTHVGTV